MGDWRSALVWVAFLVAVAALVLLVLELLDRFERKALRASLSSSEGQPRSFPSDELQARREARQRRTGGV